MAELEAQLRQLKQELAAAREKLAAANQKIEMLKEAAGAPDGCPVRIGAIFRTAAAKASRGRCCQRSASRRFVQ